MNAETDVSDIQMDSQESSNIESVEVVKQHEHEKKNVKNKNNLNINVVPNERIPTKSPSRLTTPKTKLETVDKDSIDQLTNKPTTTAASMRLIVMGLPDVVGKNPLLLAVRKVVRKANVEPLKKVNYKFE